MTDQDPCYACGAPLGPLNQGERACTNPGCEGKRFRPCGYCKASSQALFDDSVECFNKECAAHTLRLFVCPDCNFPSLITQDDGLSVCIHRNCGSNSAYVQQCEFCGNNSFLRREGLDACTAGRCDHHFKTMRRCFFCERWTFDQKEGSCQNKECGKHGQWFTECVACDQLTYDMDAGGCVNQGCPSLDATAVEPPESEFSECPACHQQTYLAASNNCVAAACRLNQEEMTLPPMPVRTGIPAPPPPVSDAELPPPGPPTETPTPTEAPPPSVTPASLVPTPAPPPASVTPAPFRPPPKPMAPEPAAFRPPNPSPTPDLASGEKLGIREAYEVVRQGLFAAGAGESSPLLLVMGTAGAGKTAFLSTLGKILQERDASYAFPYKGVEAEPIDYQRLVDLLSSEQKPQGDERLRMMGALKDRIGDLVHTFAGQVFDGFISNGIWCGYTEHDFGQFLVASITRKRQPVASIITLETSGENFAQLLEHINDLDQLALGSSPIVSVMSDMLRQAQGLVILMDPSPEADNDRTYSPFFANLARNLNHRAHMQLDAELKERLAEAGVDGKALTDNKALADSAQKGGLGRDVESALNELRFLIEQLETFGALALEEHRDRFHKVLDAVDKTRPGTKDDLQRFIDENDRHPAKQVEGWSALLIDVRPKKKYATEAEGDAGRKRFRTFAETLLSLGMPDGINRRVTWNELLARRICFARGVPDSTADDFNLELGPTGSGDQFPNLRDIGLVFSKADMHPVAYPPEKYPELKLPASCRSLERARSYLEFLGGKVRFYNSSVLGYSYFANGQFSPGIGASLTPVNVIEPIFDMLSDKIQ